MKQIRYVLLASTIMSGAAGVVMAQDAARAEPLIIAQAPPEAGAPPAEVPPDAQKQKGRERPREQRQEQKQEQRQEQRQERQQRRPDAPAERQAPPAERQAPPPRERQAPAERQTPTPRMEKQAPVERQAPPPVERSAPPAPVERSAPPAPVERSAPPPAPVEKLAPPAAPETRQAPPRAEEKQQRREDRKQERRDAPPPPAGTLAPPPVAEPTPPLAPSPVAPTAPQSPAGSASPPPAGAQPPVPPLPDRVRRPDGASGRTDGASDRPRERQSEAPSLRPAPPPSGEQPAIAPEELSGGPRTPEQRQRAERRADEDFRGRDKRFDERFNRRVEEQDGRTVIREGDNRVIVRDGDRTIIRSDENQRLGRDARNIQRERRGNEIVTVIQRPNGVEIVTVTDADGNLIRRSRRENGRDSVLIDNERAWERDGWDRNRGWGGDRRRNGGINIDFYVDIPPVRIDIPQDEYIVDADEGSYEDFEDVLVAPPLVQSERPYSLQEVTQNVRLRERVRSIDLNTITFDTGQWVVPPDQITQLDDLARALKTVIDRNPNEVYLIEGHTDAVGSSVDNLSLSDRRAEEVAAILTSNFEIPAENLVTQGYGEDYLKVNTLGANPENRRVTIRNITQLLSAQNQPQ